ncbi:MAG: hypothetical protein Q8920_17480 [Bacillota bacterium]|nr:hypothetical protein [Bacillota bacterium]
MNNNEDVEIFKLIDNVDGLEISSFLENAEFNDNRDVPYKLSEKIKKSTLTKINKGVVNRYKKLKIFGSVAASVTFIILLLSLLYPQTVYAALQKMLHFIPGIASVVDTDSDSDVYVLNKPIEKNINGCTIRLEGVTVDSERALVSMSGNTPIPGRGDVTLKNGKGQVFKTNTSWISTGSNWIGSFQYSGKINDMDALTLEISGELNLEIPLTLEKSKGYASYSEMGPTAAVNGISITAMVSRKEGKYKVDLISPPQKGMHISSYGINDQDSHPLEKQISLTGDKGGVYDIDTEINQGFGMPRFAFEPNAVDNKVRLNIPYVEIQDDNVEVPVVFNIPEKGSAVLNKTVDVVGFHVDFTRIERISDISVRIYTDVHFKNDSSEALQFFNLYYKNSSGGWMAELDNKTMAIKYFEIDIKPGLKKVKLYITGPKITKRGPWNIEIPLN